MLTYTVHDRSHGAGRSRGAMCSECILYKPSDGVYRQTVGTRTEAAGPISRPPWGGDGNMVGLPMPALGFIYEGQAGGWNRGRKRKANKWRTTPRIRPEQLEKGGARSQVGGLRRSGWGTVRG